MSSRGNMMQTSTSTENQTSTDGSPFKWQVTFLAYGIVMFLILTVGFLGNALTLIVLRHRKHRKKAVTPLMINLAIADIFIIVFGYPVIISVNLRGERLRQNSARCIWSGFSNGVTGISSIASLVAMSGVMYHVIKQTVPNPTLPARRMFGLIAGTWLYGIFVNLPPLLGWNRFVPGEAGISCAPDWTASDLSSVLYIVWLVAFGFFLPLIAICVLHYLTYKVITRALRYIPGNATIQAKRRNSQMKLIRMTAVCIAAFILSWSPYCFVSLAGTIKGDHVLTSGEAEIPELLAKASVVFNPIIYMVTNSNFRATLWGIMNGRDTVKIKSNVSSVITQNSGRHTAAFSRPLENTPV